MFVLYLTMTSEQDISHVRELFLNEVSLKPDLYDEEDIERVHKNDFYVFRFVNFLGQGVDKGFLQMKECYQWRRSSGINKFSSLEDYPTALHSAVFPYFPGNYIFN